MSDNGALAMSERLREEAEGWFARIEGGTPTAEELEAFEIWLKATPEHLHAYQETINLWAALKSPVGDMAMRRAQTSGKQNASWWQWVASWHFGAPASAMGVAVLIFWIFVPNLFTDLGADYVTARGETRTIILPDHSEVEMAANTAIALTFGEGRRGVKLLRGEAYFKVRRSTQGLAFLVQAGPAKIKVLGTQFDVDRLGILTEITVSEGAVVVSGEQAGRPATLTQGEHVTAREGKLSAVAVADMGSLLSWRQGRLMFNQQPLQRVIERINRYREGRIIVANPALRNMKISGTFPAHDTDAALDAITRSIGARLIYVSRYVLIVL